MSSTMKPSNIKRLIFLIKAMRYRNAKYFGFKLRKTLCYDADIRHSTF